MHLNPSLTVAGVLLAGVFCQWFASRIKAPAIIPLRAGAKAGVLLLNFIDRRVSFGEPFFPLILLLVALIFTLSRTTWT